MLGFQAGVTIPHSQVYFCWVLGEAGIAVDWRGLSGLSRGDTCGAGRPKEKGGAAGRRTVNKCQRRESQP
jgi:hypothetical protein